MSKLRKYFTKILHKVFSFMKIFKFLKGLVGFGNLCFAEIKSHPSAYQTYELSERSFPHSRNVGIMDFLDIHSAASWRGSWLVRPIETLSEITAFDVGKTVELFFVQFGIVFFLVLSAMYTCEIFWFWPGTPDTTRHAPDTTRHAADNGFVGLWSIRSE